MDSLRIKPRTSDYLLAERVTTLSSAEIKFAKYFGCLFSVAFNTMLATWLDGAFRFHPLL